MRIATYVSPVSGGERVGVLEGDQLLGIDEPVRLLDLLGDDGERLADAAHRAKRSPAEVVPLDQARLMAPIPVPPSIRDFMAFEEHVRNAGRHFGHEPAEVWYRQPIFYFSNPAAVRAARGDIEISPGSIAFDYELEVAAVVGKAGRNLSPTEAVRHIAGFLVLCDWSARDLQRAEMEGHLGPAKGKDGATSLGPYLVTPDELAGRRKGNGFDLEMFATVNGQEGSKGNWSAIHWSFEELLAYASRGTEVRPGDVLGSGTVGTGCIAELQALHGAEAYPWLKAGDEVRLEVELLGSIEARIRPAPSVLPIR